jgi:hypothetical protein
MVNFEASAAAGKKPEPAQNPELAAGEKP